MKRTVNKGIGFGITSGIITTLGLMIGLFEATNSKLAVLGGILTIAIADALSDSFGIHISEEAAGKSKKNIWQSTFSTFKAKFLTAIIFVIPVIFLTLKTAIITNILMGLIILSTFTYFITKRNKQKPFNAILEHLGIALIVILITYFVGKGISTIGLI